MNLNIGLFNARGLAVNAVDDLLSHSYSSPKPGSPPTDPTSQPHGHNTIATQYQTTTISEILLAYAS
jgi:hypothetical protein